MNRKQRMRNRGAAAKLSKMVRDAQPCPECGEPCEGGHWVTTRHVTLEDQIRAQHSGVPLNPADFGFWTCRKFYDENHRRLPEHRVTRPGLHVKLAESDKIPDEYQATFEPHNQSLLNAVLGGSGSAGELMRLASGPGKSSSLWQIYRLAQEAAGRNPEDMALFHGLPGFSAKDLPGPFTEEQLDEILGIKTPEQKVFLDKLEENLLQEWAGKPKDELVDGSSRAN